MKAGAITPWRPPNEGGPFLLAGIYLTLRRRARAFLKTRTDPFWSSRVQPVARFSGAALCLSLV